MQTTYEDCVESINLLLSYDEKITKGLILQVWCFESSEQTLRDIVLKYTGVVIDIQSKTFTKTLDIEFPTCDLSNEFKKCVANIKEIRVYTNSIVVGGRKYKKPEVHDIERRKQFLINENCGSFVGSFKARSI